MKTIDMTPTWGEVGRIYLALLDSEEWKALRHARPEFARAFAGMEALNAVLPTLTDEQKATVSRVLAEELTKMGY